MKFLRSKKREIFEVIDFGVEKSEIFEVEKGGTVEVKIEKF